jgi:hypothetical protein
MVRRLLSLLIAFALMTCLGAMMPQDVYARAPVAMRMDAPPQAAAHGDCAHHRDNRLSCHGCPICVGVDAPRPFVWAHRPFIAASDVGMPRNAALLAEARPSGLDRPPRRAS